MNSQPTIRTDGGAAAGIARGITVAFSSIVSLRKLVPAGILMVSLMVPGRAVSEYSYETSFSGAIATITGYHGPGGVVVIPEYLDGRPVWGIGDHAFQGQDTITDITLHDEIRSVGPGGI